MSYDGWLVIDTGGPEMAEVVELGNYTSNVAPMWRKALSAAGEDIRLSDTGGRISAEVLPLLQSAVAHMREHPDEYRPLDPENGWGDYEGALTYLAKVADECERNPRTSLQWWV